MAMDNLTMARYFRLLDFYKNLNAAFKAMEDGVRELKELETRREMVARLNEEDAKKAPADKEAEKKAGEMLGQFDAAVARKADELAVIVGVVERKVKDGVK